MIKECVINTLKFFDLQDLPVTLLELHSYLIGDLEKIKPLLDNQWDLTAEIAAGEKVAIEAVFKCLDVECLDEVDCSQGFYYLKGRESLVEKRLHNYSNGIKREKLIRR